MNFSRSASNIVGQYYQLSRLGKDGFRAIMENIQAVTKYLAHKVQRLGFVVLSDIGGNGLPIVVFRLKDQQKFDEFDISRRLREYGWVVPAYTLPPHAHEVKVLRIVIRQDMSYRRCDSLVRDLESILGIEGGQ